jgi:formyl-CoA transferase
MQLADLGADVVRSRTRGRDLSRRLAPVVNGERHLSDQPAKRSIALDLKRESAGRVRRLAARADVSSRTCGPARARPQAGSARTPREPASGDAAVTGWGLDGPYADRPALDFIIQAMSGLMSVTGEEGGAPVKVGVSISDLTAGLYATIAILGALAVRTRDGRGQLVDVSMFESSVSLAVWEAGTYFTTGEVPRAAGSAHRAHRPVPGHPPPTSTSSSARPPPTGRHSAARSASPISSAIRTGGRHAA